MCSFLCRYYYGCPIKYRALNNLVVGGDVVLNCEELVRLFLVFQNIKELSKLPLELEKDV